MYWLAVSVAVARSAIEPLSDALFESGALSVDVGDAAAGTAWEKPIFDALGGAPAPQWEHGRVSVLFSSDTNIERAMVRAFTVAGIPSATAYEVRRVDDQDWVRATQAQFGPQHISSRLWIVPSWHTPPDRHALNIFLDPGVAFGTGSHPTTRLCLRWLENALHGGESVIDFGCGSGILAIAAVKLGAGPTIGVDIDTLALAAAASNAARNDVEVVFVSAADRLHDAVDVVVANILANPLIVLMPLLTRLTRRGGRLALSGILAEQADEVAATYAPAFDLAHPMEEDGWVLLSGVKR